MIFKATTSTLLRTTAFALALALAACSEGKDEGDPTLIGWDGGSGGPDGGHAGADAGDILPGDEWGAPELLEQDTGLPIIPTLATTPDGRAFVAWGTLDVLDGVPSMRIHSRSYEPGAGWTGVTSLDDGSGRATGPALGADGNGNVIAVWLQLNGSASHYNTVFAARHDGTAWSEPQQLDSHDTIGVFNYLSLSVAADGTAWATWHYSAGGEIHASRFEPDSGWTPPMVVAADAENPQVSAMSGGKALIAYRKAAQIEGRIWTPEAGLSEPEVVIAFDALSWNLAASQTGWYAGWIGKSDAASETGLWARERPANGAWGTAAFTSALGSMMVADSTTNSAGELLVVSIGLEDEVIVSRFSTQAGWSAKAIATERKPSGVSIASASDGTLALAFSHPAGVYVTRDTGAGWNAPALVSNLRDPNPPRVGIDGLGNTFVAWGEDNDLGLYANRLAK